MCACLRSAGTAGHHSGPVRGRTEEGGAGRAARRARPRAHGPARRDGRVPRGPALRAARAVRERVRARRRGLAAEHAPAVALPRLRVRVEPHDQKLFGEFGEKTLNELINYVLNKPVIETLGEIGQYILNNYEDFTLVIIAFVFITVFKAFDRRYPFNKNEKGGIISYFFRFLGFPSNYPDSPEHNKKSPRPGIFELFFIA